MVVTTKAIVFSSIKYAEADLIVTCFTESSGIKTYLLRGVLKSKKGKVRASYFQLLTQLEIVAFHKDKGTLENIREAKVTFPYQSISTDVVKSSMAMFLAEMLKNCIKEEEANVSLFQFIESALQWLDTHEHIANFHIYFLLKLSMYLGFYPDESSIELPYFNLADGVFEATASNIYCEEGEAVAAVKQFFGINFDEIAHIKLTKKARHGALHLLLSYYQLHLQGYRKPKSLLVLNQLFN